MALGAVLMGAIFTVEWLLGWVDVTGFWSAPPGVPFVVAILAPLVLSIVVAVSEELLARGNQLLNFAEGFRLLGIALVDPGSVGDLLAYLWPAARL